VVLHWAPYWLAVTLLITLVYLAVGLIRFPRRLQTWEVVGLTLLCLVLLPLTFLATLAYVAVALIRLRRHFPHWQALAVALFLMACAGSVLDIGAHALARPGLTLVIWAVVPSLFLLYFYLFSDGRFVPRSTRWLAIVYGLGQIGHLFAASSTRSSNHAQLPDTLLVHTLVNAGMLVGDVAGSGIVIVGIVPQVYARYRYLSQAGGRPRRRGRLLGAALAVGVGAVVASALVFVAPGGMPPGWPAVAATGLYFVLVCSPVLLGLAVLQVRPYDRAALAYRALVYGTLTICLVLVYAASAVVVSTFLLGGLGASQLAVIASLVVIAALFRPLRAWAQRGVDRWLFPRKYEAGPIFAGLNEALRMEIQLAPLSEQLVAAVHTALRPSSVTLWLRTSPSLSAQAMERLLPAPARADKNGGPGRPEAPTLVLEAQRRAGGEAAQPAAPTLTIAPDDSIRATLPPSAGAVDVDQLPADSSAMRALRAAGSTLVLALASEGELLGLLALGPRASGERYSFDEEELLDGLAAQVAPALRTAQLVYEQGVQGRERARVEQELTTARRIQQTLLPKAIPELDGWQIAAYYQPAREVGGDFYDFLPFSDGRLGFVVGDVTDKGVPAALVMATTRSMLRAAAQDSVPPGAVLARVNELLCADLPPNMFVTCFYAILDPSSGRLRYANAGQDLPYLRRPDGCVAELRARGMPLGLMPGMTYDERETELGHGDRVLFYSDGLVEAHNPRREMFGFPRLAALLESDVGEPGTIEALLGELATFTGTGWEQEDDVTLVTLWRGA
jgi:serine phosphatase RsbU (regulator of sigma subunit)